VAWAQNLEIARAEVGKRLIEVQERQKQRYEAQHRPAKEFQQGEEVLVYKPFRKVGRAEKLLNRWLGPYTVVRRTSSLNYEVTRPRSKQTESVHVVKMKRFIRKDEQTMADTEKSTKLTEDVPTDTHQEKPSEESASEGERTKALEETKRRSERVRRASAGTTQWRRRSEPFFSPDWSTSTPSRCGDGRRKALRIFQP
jgi:hypothetical protein